MLSKLGSRLFADPKQPVCSRREETGFSFCCGGSGHRGVGGPSLDTEKIKNRTVRETWV